MKKVIPIKLTSQSIDQAIKEFNEWKEMMLEKTQELLWALGEEGIQVMSAKFFEAVYDGTNITKCEIQERGEDKIALLAIGNSVLFIEFGTGVKYPDNHPEAHEHGMIRGEYGKGKGKNPEGWRYVGEPGTNGVRSASAKVKSVVHTYGNPANRCAYDTVRELEERFERIAKKVFND